MGKSEAPDSGVYLDVNSPLTNEAIGKVAVANQTDVQKAIANAESVQDDWRNLTSKSRANIMIKFHQLVQKHQEELADLVVMENGKNRAEALASIAKGNETVEYAISIPQLTQGKILQVSRGIMCQESKDPVGIVASIVPFNFPIMVPMWTVPIALTVGNCVILKPSEKVPMTMTRVAELFKEAGVPDGVFQIIHGDKMAVDLLCESDKISAVTFVGSSKVAEIVAKKCRSLNKRVLALGGAKNHLVALEDADVEMAASDIVASFAGCAGQRCMAASVLLCVGDCEELIKLIVAKAKKLKKGTEQGQVGAIIDQCSKDRILSCINEAVDVNKAQILCDGRSWDCAKGNWIGPTVLLHNQAEDPIFSTEVFGPVLSILKVNSFDEALRIENQSEYGNAASIYTSNGGHADFFQRRFRAGMIGVNIGVPVPREPFSFGGLYGTKSKFGDMDITGDGAIEFFTNRRKITSKWKTNSTNVKTKDAANFTGQL